MANNLVEFKYGDTLEGKTVAQDDFIAINKGIAETSETKTVASKMGSLYKGDKILGTTEADKLCLTGDITVTGTTVGNFTNGMKLDKGTDVMAVLTQMLMKELDVTASNPTTTITNTGTPGAGTYEVGTSISVNLGHTYKDGTFRGVSGYSYGPIDAGCAEGVTTYKKNNVAMGVNTDTFVITEGGTNYSCSTTYEASTIIPVTNFGNDSSVKINAGTANSGNVSFNGAYKYFMGYSDNTSVASFDTVSVRALTVKTGNVTNNGNTSVVGSTPIASNGKSIVIACPTKYKLSGVENGLGANILANFSEIGTVSVTTGTIETEYNVYIYPITNGAVVEFKNMSLNRA